MLPDWPFFLLPTCRFKEYPWQCGKEGPGLFLTMLQRLDLLTSAFKSSASSYLPEPGGEPGKEARDPVSLTAAKLQSRGMAQSGQVSPKVNPISSGPSGRKKDVRGLEKEEEAEAAAANGNTV